MTEETKRGASDRAEPHAITPDVIGAIGREPDADVVGSSSSESFPASDPPSWSGSSPLPSDREPEPEGEQATWSVEHDLRRDRDRSEPLEQTGEPDAKIPVPPEDALQA